jgi:hypothetical protein
MRRNFGKNTYVGRQSAHLIKVLTSNYHIIVQSNNKMLCYNLRTYELGKQCLLLSTHDNVQRIIYYTR